MTVSSMVALVKQRTHVNDDTKVISEVQNAYRWVQRRVFNSQDGGDLLSTMDTEKTLSAVTTTYDIGANVTGEFLGLKQLWLKLPSDTVFTPMTYADTNSLQFLRNDSP